jgi:valyl-tRNA synthetase
MSKSIGNVIDPLDSIAEFGTDALRFTLAVGTTPGQVGLHAAISPLSFVSFAMFTNGSRVVLLFLDLEPAVHPPQLGRKLADSKRATQPQSLALASSCTLLSTSEKRHHEN